MRLTTALASTSLAVGAAMAVFSVGFYGPDDPYVTWGIALLALPPAAIGALLLAPWRSVRAIAGWLAVVPGAWWVVSGGADILSGMLTLGAGATHRDPAGTIGKGVLEALLGALDLAIFWAAVLRERGTRPSPPSRSVGT